MSRARIAERFVTDVSGNRDVAARLLRLFSGVLFSGGRRPSRDLGWRTAFLSALLLLVLMPSVAQAAPHGVVGVFGSLGADGGQLNNPRGIAVNDSSGAVYVVSTRNRRVERLSAAGAFELAWGKDVVKVGATGDTGSGYEVCIAETACQTGVFSPDGAGGEFNFSNNGGDEPDGAGIAIDQVSGDVYVTDGNFRRVQQFSADGEFVRAWGADVVRSGGAGDVPTPGLDEQQTVQPQSFGGTITGGTFTLTFAGQTTTPIAYDADAAAVEAALTGLSNVEPGDVAVTDAELGGWTVTFTGAFASADVAQMTGSAMGLTGSGFTNVVTVTTVTAGGSSAGPLEICTVRTECKAGLRGARGGEFGVSLASRLAVAPAGAPNAGNVIVGDGQNGRVQEFDPDAATAAGLFVRTFGWDVVQTGGTGDDNVGTPNELEICTVAVECKAGSSGSGIGQFGADGPSRVAVDSTGAVYAVDPAVFRVQKFTPQAGPPALAASVFAAASIPAASATKPRDVFVDASDRVYVMRSFPAGASTCASGSNSEAESRVVELTTAGLEVADSPHLACAGVSPAGLAVHSGSGQMYLTYRDFQVLLSGVTTTPTATMGVSTATHHTAGVAGLVNPNGPGGATGVHTTYRFDYWKTSDPGAVTVGAEASVGNGTAPVPVSLQLSGLDANTEYAVRLVATKPFTGGNVQTPAQTFTTTVARPDAAAGAFGRTATSATLTARINPNNSPTSYRFQYGMTAGYGTEVPVPDGSVGSGATEVTVTEQLTDLQPDTTYHFRVVATNANGTTTTQDRTFTTQPVPGPDGRAYELVSPAYKIGGVGVGSWGSSTNHVAGFPAYEGDRFAAIGSWGSMLLDGSAAFANDYAFADRTPSGWVSHSPFTRGLYGSHNYRFANMLSSADDLSTIAWISNGGTLRMFPEQESWTQDTVLASDWAGNWEVVAPTSAPDQGQFATSVAAANGGHVAVVLEKTIPITEGLAGVGDPYLDTPSDKRRLYLDDVSQGLSNTFPGAGVRSPVGICTGSGSGRTQLPARDGAGKIGTVPCPAPLPGRDAALISPLGATLPFEQQQAPFRGLISRDGDRVLFMSPDTVSAPCAGTGADTVCPTQAYIYQRGADGSVTTRWVSRSSVDGQDAALIGPAYVQGASATSDKVFFQTNSPLTADDPNGGPQIPGGVKSGSADSDSWDLYRYDVPSAHDGRPGDADPGDGRLVRISAGPTGAGDCNVVLGDEATRGALRFVSEDGNRVYFTCAAPLPGVPTPTNGTSTSPGGSVTDQAAVNLYLYDATRAVADQWEFVARIPHDLMGATIAACASTSQSGGSALDVSGSADLFVIGKGNCVSGTSDGEFITFFTVGQLTSDDPDATSADLYGFDAAAHELVRLTASQGGTGGTYTCIQGPVTPCHGSLGVSSGAALKPLTVVADPATQGQRVAFLESQQRLVPEDVNDVSDVYQWRDGRLSLISSGASDAAGSYYKGIDRAGENVYFVTKDKLTWQDVDAVADIYTARLSGGIPEPALPEPCNVLGDACQGGGVRSIVADPQTISAVTDGNAGESQRKRLTVAALSAKARRKAARSGVLRLSVRTTAPGRVRAVAKGRVGKRSQRVAGRSVLAATAGRVTLKLALSRAARRQLGAGEALTLTVRVTSPGARARTSNIRLSGAQS